MADSSLIDTKELKEAFERFFRNPEYHKERIERLIEQWEREDKKNLEKVI